MTQSPSSKKPAAPCEASPSWEDADRDGRRSIIVEQALQLLHDSGLDAVSMRGVASRLGVGTMTLYTYVAGQDELRQAMIRRGFELLGEGCRDAGETLLEEEGSWRGGAGNYLRFALSRPNLYHLMFAAPLPPEDDDLLAAGFEPLLERIRDRLRETRGLKGAALNREARRQAGRYWIGLHGLATLAISKRTTVLEGDLDTVLADLLEAIAPA